MTSDDRLASLDRQLGRLLVALLWALALRLAVGWYVRCRQRIAARRVRLRAFLLGQVAEAAGSSSE